ncbi:GPI ethanolamine phosphate transferase 1 [Hypoxylon trugodes]|uniref:GPI ethanolamine phosphate transferase 1 n=1 Tax=Hypoxylon trugodes TaxID=326681 RepID=UPI002197FC01|nr:GPI ethanolamine phosphate transferase 1 [Hypoxylon trugodes]KAI1386283.1 GPI ethanolamine phosphate transferase 1 [Hypoxylon trugodes]
MAGTSQFKFLVIAMVFHLIYIYSIFDVYFVSPIVSGMQLFQVERPSGVKAPADRLVLYVGDGLRADKAFQSFPEPYPETEADEIPRPLAPYLRSRVLEHGTFGVSHTRVPTESRPGHVALIAGLYEDVSAVATGWKLNPVNFDSVFNRSAHTWSWGSPDILPMFEYGATPGRIDTDCYDAEFEDFSKDALELDIYVFDHVKEFFAAAEKNKTLNDALRQDKVVFFLHLLGIDTTGHSYRPYSKEYLHNIKVVDEGVKEITELIQKFYNDDRTAFVFTADHGMSDWGSHGDGHPDNTRTPLIAWGSGLAKPVVYPGAIAPGHDKYSLDWDLNEVKRNDVQQADVAALMAYLIGAEFPANSVGEIPLPYLSASIKEKAEASLVNAQEILEMYKVKENGKKTSEIRYRPFKPLSEGSGSTPEDRVSSIRALINSGNYEEAIEESAALMKIGLEGMRYLQTYDWLFLRALITIGYLGWMAYALTTVLDLHVLQGSTQASRNLGGTVFFSSVLVILYASFLVSRSPITYYAYAFFPVFFWEEVFARRDSLIEGRKALFGHIKTGANVVTLGLNFIIYVGIIESLAFGYIHREVFTVLFIIGGLYPLTIGISFLQKHIALSATWFISCLLMSIFTLLPAMKVENIPLTMLGGVLMVAVGVLYLIFEEKLLIDISDTKKQSTAKTNNDISRTVIGVQIGLILLAMYVTRDSALSLQAKQGLPRGNRAVAWLVLIVSFLMPLAHRLQPNNHYLHRLLVIFLTCAPTFVMLTISYEGLFYFAFSLLLLTWVRIEHHGYNFVQSTKKASGEEKSTTKVEAQTTVSEFRPLALSDARIALFFFVLLQSAFFSTGNIASISSFSLESVNRLMPVFDPFSQGALLILKIMIPFVLISANLGILNKRIGVAPSALFMLAMALSDILTLYFFWVVKDEGSWLEIGSTITHFAIASLLCVFVAGLEGVSTLFIVGIEVNNSHELKATSNGKALDAPPKTEVTNGETKHQDPAPISDEK